MAKSFWFSGQNTCTFYLRINFFQNLENGCPFGFLGRICSLFLKKSLGLEKKSWNYFLFLVTPLTGPLFSSQKYPFWNKTISNFFPPNFPKFPKKIGGDWESTVWEVRGGYRGYANPTPPHNPPTLRTGDGVRCCGGPTWGHNSHSNTIHPILECTLAAMWAPNNAAKELTFKRTLPFSRVWEVGGGSQRFVGGVRGGSRRFANPPTTPHSTDGSRFFGVRGGMRTSSDPHRGTPRSEEVRTRRPFYT